MTAALLVLSALAFAGAAPAPAVSNVAAEAAAPKVQADLRLAGEELTVAATGAAVPMNDPAAACAKFAAPVRPVVEVAADAAWAPVARVLELIRDCGKNQAGLVVAGGVRPGPPVPGAAPVLVELVGQPPPTFLRVLPDGAGLVVRGLELAGLGPVPAQAGRLARLAALEGAVAVEGGRDVATGEVLRVLGALTLHGPGAPKLPRIVFSWDQIGPQTLLSLLAIRSYAPGILAAPEPIARPGALRPIFGAVENVRLLEVKLPGWTQQAGGVCTRPDGTVILFSVGLSTSIISRARQSQAESRARRALAESLKLALSVGVLEDERVTSGADGEVAATGISTSESASSRRVFYVRAQLDSPKFKKALPAPACAEGPRKVLLPETAAPVDENGRFLVPEDVDVHGPELEGQLASEGGKELLQFALVPSATPDVEAVRQAREALQRRIAGNLSFSKDRFSPAGAACAADAPSAIAAGANVKLVEAPAAQRRLALASVAIAALPALLTSPACAAGRAEVLEPLSK